MGRLITYLLLVGATQLSGCSAWPQSGKGGQAEHYPGDLLPVEAGQLLSYQHGLRLDINHSQRHLDILVMAGAKRCFPASVRLAKLRENRIIREIAGGLYNDAANNIVIQRIELNKIDQKLKRS